MGWFRKSIRPLAVAALALALTGAACGSNDKSSSDSTAAKGSLTIGSANFTESEIVANIYAAALRAKGYTVNVRAKLGPREITQPALEKGEIDLMPEYVGSLLNSLQKDAATGDLQASLAKLKTLLAPKSLTVLEAASAYDTNALVVTKATAAKYKLTKVSDLAPIAGTLSFGAAAECPGRALCALGYKDKYGITFKTFKPLDSGGPLTKQALKNGDIDVAQLYSSDIPADTVVLTDDKALQPAENVVPEIRTSKATAEVKSILDAVAAKLTLDELVDLNQKAAADKTIDLSKLGDDWAKEYKLA
jgi:osmoprotectant transport system substrate-binding protein